MADSQVPRGVDAVIPPPARRAMAERADATVSEAPGRHAIYVSSPDAVAAVVRAAAATWSTHRVEPLA